MSSARGGWAAVRTARAGGPRVSTERRAASRRRAAPLAPRRAHRRTVCGAAASRRARPASARPAPHTTRRHLRLLPLPLRKKKVN